MRLLYSLLTYLLLPFATLRLYWKSRQNSAYRQRIAERFAYKLPAQFSNQLTERNAQPLLIHTVSVGEFLSIKPLLAALLNRPGLNLWITTTTPTGSAQVQQFQQRYPTQIKHSYLPYDAPHILKRFLRHVQPRMVILMETEIWPNLIAQSAAFCPVLLINARLSAKSLRGYKRFAAPLLAHTLQHLNINAQTQDDARRFRQLGAPAAQVSVTPSIKYQTPAPQHNNAVHPPATRKDAVIWLAASTHAPEECYALAAHQELIKQHPNYQLIIAPRHPERRAQICADIRTYGFTPKQRSKGEWFTDKNDVVLLDTLGELAAFYGIATAAFIGGSLIPRGGHNPLEAVHAGCSVCYGSSMYNFTQISRHLDKQSFVQRLHDHNTLADTITDLITHHAEQRAAIAAFNDSHHNIIARHIEFIDAYLPQ